MSIHRFRSFFCIIIVGLCAARVSAVELFSDNFNTNTSANWTVNKAPTAVDPNKQTAQFAFDYSAFGIPSAPGSSDTLGLRLRANLPLDGNGNEVTGRPAQFPDCLFRRLEKISARTTFCRSTRGRTSSVRRMPLVLPITLIPKAVHTPSCLLWGPPAPFRL